MKIRKMLENDYDIIDKMMLDLHDFHVKGCPAVYRQVEHMYSKDEYLTLIQDKNQICLVAELAEDIIGFCIVEKRRVENSCMVPVEFGYMDSLYISPLYRKKGLGKSLFKLVEEKLIREDIQSLRLTVWNFNKDAIAFYKDMGLEVEKYLCVKDL